MHRTFLLTAVCLLITPTISAQSRPVDFARDVRPILQTHCIRCHGDADREGGLRLSNRRDAFTASDSGEPVIVPGDPQHSLLLQRVTADDEFLIMPPDGEGERLSAQQVAILTEWIRQGADWTDTEPAAVHWAYVSPRRPALPDVEPADWSRNAIDSFVLQQLQQRQLQPAGPEEAARLLRRVSLALTGLPPTVQQVRNFQQDPSPAAYEAIVEQLLASPRFGERWARPWLDLARYADSNGFQADQLRDSWAYRDWVIDALNSDMPYDQFVTEQLAGDLLPQATVDQKVATGFHRTVTCNVEAGVDPEENRVNQVIDRVNTTGTVFLGTTLECCQCHNHKYDPFTQEEYYRLFAYFNNTPLEVKLNSGVSYDFYGPTMDLPLDQETQSRYQDISQQLEQLNSQRQQQIADSRKAQSQWESELTAAVDQSGGWQVLPIQDFSATGGEQHTLLEDHSVLLSGTVPDRTTSTITVRTELNGITAFRIEALTHESLPGDGPGRGDPERRNFILSEFGVQVGSADDFTAVELHSAEADFSQTKWEVAKAIDGDPQTGWAIAPRFGESHWAIFRTVAPVEQFGQAEPTTLQFKLVQNYGSGRVLGRIRLSAFTGHPDALNLSPELVTILQKAKRSPAEQKQLTKLYQSRDPELEQLDSRIRQLQAERDQLQPPTTLVMTELDQPRQTTVMLRGDYLNPGREVSYGTPAVLHPLDASLPANRLGLATWLVSKDNPLLARVAVNRLWAEIFGHGLVATLEDFGTQSDPPTHPQLLDWLACELMEPTDSQRSAWSLKHIVKLMVMSATFRQAARVTPDLLEADPDNKWYARGPRFRMSAETIRDNGLAVSGLLSTRMYGPPVMPYQPDGIWRQVGRNEPVWKAASDENRFRRGVYVVYRRAAPYPSFVNFDAPDRASCVARRPRTNTPLQALTLLNDPAYLEMALSLATHILTELPQSTPREQAIYGMQRCVARVPTSEEIDHLLQIYETERDRLQQNPDAAKQLIGSVSGFQPDPTIDKTELAAWFFVANVLLNLDETISR